MKYNTLYQTKRRSAPFKLAKTPSGDTGITFIRKNGIQGYIPATCDLDSDFFARNQQAEMYNQRDLNDIGKLLLIA